MNQSSYLHNPYIHRDRQLSVSPSKWQQTFTSADMAPLIICRGPIRKEAIDVFTEMGITHFGLLLSEKDSIVYPFALAPELRMVTPAQVHRVRDYSGTTKEDRLERIRQIIQIAKDNNYNSVFAGYGFMAEDDGMVEAVENAGLIFIGPRSSVIKRAGLKDEAKRTALSIDVSVTPGINNLTALTLLRKYPDLDALKAVVEENNLNVSSLVLANGSQSLEDKADLILNASYEKGIDIISIDDICNQVTDSVRKMFEDYPENRIRFKAIGGGGGKGQRIMSAPSSFDSAELSDRIEAAAASAPGLVREILSEVKATGVGDNKNILIELNIETTRHLEIQLIGNGDWCLSMGARDCSLQMHEQKLLEVSVTQEALKTRLGNEENATVRGSLERDLKTLAAMEEEAARFGKAVGLDSVSTFECIVDRDQHFFMEMNTRIQVEHRVTELCYGLKFTNPDSPEDYFVIESLLEAMMLIAFHKDRLPKPERVVRENASVEARLNATNEALAPHAGGLIEFWSTPIEDEIRDDQGIRLLNPDTNVFMKYALAGAYDSNIALLLTCADDRRKTYEQMANILRKTELHGKDLETNLNFHYGLVNWFLSQGVDARPTTRFIVPYLTAVGLLRKEARNIDVDLAYKRFQAFAIDGGSEEEEVRNGLNTAFDRTKGMLLRAIKILIDSPHLLSGWLSHNRRNFVVKEGRVSWLKNPVRVLMDTYHFLNMDWHERKPAAHMIWREDNELLEQAISFYDTLEEKMGTDCFRDLEQAICSNCPPNEIDPPLWTKIRSAHLGYQAGMHILSILPYLADQAKFFDLKMNEDLSITIPEFLCDPDLQTEARKILVPPPVAKSDEILAASGGMYYPREAPGMPEFVKEGSHFEKGDPLYIVEVMKMFTKVYAPFSGVIDKVLIDGEGIIISKGQPLFKTTPDESLQEESPESANERIRQKTEDFLHTNLLNHIELEG